MSINTTLQTKFREAVKYFFSVPVVAKAAFQKDFAISNLIGGTASMLRGAPGVGKTNAARAWGKVFFGEDTVVVNAYEGIRPEDFLFYINIEQHYKNGGPEKQQFVFDVQRRPALLSRFTLLNEFNRVGKDTQNSVLSIISEGFIEVQSKRLDKEYGKIWIDFNPYYGNFDYAFTDRMITSLVMPALDIYEQIQLSLRKAKYGADLAGAADQKMNHEEMIEIWSDVEKIDFPATKLAHGLLSLNIFRACKYQLDTASEKFITQLDCENCTFRDHCLTKMLERPVLTRSLDAFVRACKASAYADGRDSVVPQLDFMPAVRLSLAHRLQLRPTQLEAYPHEYEWFDKVAKVTIEGRLEEWKAAREIFDDIKVSIKARDAKKAISKFNKYVDSSKDITARSMIMDLGGAKIKAMAEEYAKEGLLKLEAMRDRKMPYSKSDLEGLTKTYDWLPKDQVEAIKHAIDCLEYGLHGRYVLDTKDYEDLVRKLGVRVPSSVKNLTFAKDGATFCNYSGGGVNVSASATSKGVDVTWDSDTSELADVFVAFDKKGK